MTNPAMSGGRDDTTRYLCAAAHLDETFADGAIREFLVEPTRAVPPSPGVYAPAVLTEAVAARARRKLRDGALLALALVVLASMTLSLVGVWVVIGLAALVATTASANRSDLVRRLGPVVIGLAVVGIVVYLVVTNLDLGGSGSPPGLGEFDYGAAEPGPPDIAGPVLSVVAILGMFAVLLVDEFVVARHINDRFRRGRRIGDVVVRPDQRQVLAFASSRSLAQLGRHLRGPQEPMAPGGYSTGNGGRHAPATVIVSRSFSPFAGAGLRHKPWSLAVPLEPQSDADPVPLTPADLYRRVSGEVAGLRESASLSPGRRFTELRVTEQIVVSAGELIDHDDATARDFLASHQAAPYPLLRAERVRELRDDPQEWARYYLCLQLETWDRDFVVSVYVHLAVNNSTLYVEWTPCVLLPIRAKFRKIDARPLSPWPTIAAALGQLVALPATLPKRFAQLFSRMRPVPRQRGVISADMFGAGKSLRELAADSTVHNYFQLADLDRYVKVLESRLTLAVIDVLKEAGYSVAALEKRVEAVSSGNLFINSPVTGNVVGGSGNKVSGMTMTGAGAAK